MRRRTKMMREGKREEREKKMEMGLQGWRGGGRDKEEGRRRKKRGEGQI